MLMVLAAIAELKPATLVRIAARTAIPKRTVTDLVRKARVQAGVNISKRGPAYRILDWGSVLQRKGAMQALKPKPASRSGAEIHDRLRKVR